MELDISNIIQTTLNSFDFALVITINILTYVIIKTIDEINGEKKVSILLKRIILIFSIVIVSVIYSVFDFCDNRLILNSAILAPVFWSWIGKPLCKKFGIDYKDNVS